MATLFPDDLVLRVKRELFRTLELELQGKITKSAGHPETTLPEAYAILAEETHEVLEQLDLLRNALPNKVLKLAHSVNEVGEMRTHLPLSAAYYVECAKTEVIQVMSVCVNIHKLLERLEETVKVVDDYDEVQVCMD